MTSRLISKLTTHRTKSYSSATLLKEEEEERYSCWCFVSVDGTRFDAKIVHKGRGKFKILNDEYDGRHANEIIDASDVIRCKTEI